MKKDLDRSRARYSGGPPIEGAVSLSVADANMISDLPLAKEPSKTLHSVRDLSTHLMMSLRQRTMVPSSHMSR
eukprot:2304381-Amphidinium_carterae.1